MTNLEAPLVTGADPVAKGISVLENLEVDPLTLVGELGHSLVFREEGVNQLVVEASEPVHRLLDPEAKLGHDGGDGIVFLVSGAALSVNQCVSLRSLIGGW